MKTLIVIISLLLFSINTVFAQSRFDQFVSEGKRELKVQNFEKAINKFKAAKITPGISSDQIRLADQQIEFARDGFIAAIQKANEETKIALNKAQTEARISEANRLAFLANQYVEKGNYEEAFQVAAIAYNMVREDAPNLVEKAFGDAGYHQFSKLLESENTPVLEIKQTPNGNHFAVLFRSGSPLLFDRTGNLIQRMSGHQSRILDLTSSKNNNGFATCSEDGLISFWNKEGVLKNTFQADNQTFAKKINSIADDRYLALFNDHSFKIISSNGELIFSKQEDSRITTVSCSPDGKRFVTCTAKGIVKLWNAFDQTMIKELESNDRYIYQARFSKDGARILLVPQGAPVLTFDLSGQLIATFRSKAFSEAPYELCLATNGKHLAIASENGLVEIWSMEGDFINSFQRKKDKKGLLKFSSDGKKIASIYDTQSFVIWDIEKGESIIFDQHKEDIIALSFSPKNQYILSCSKDNTAKLWNLNGSLMTNMNLHKGPLSIAEFVNDGTYILTGGMDHQLFYAPAFQTILDRSNEVTAKALTKSQKEKWGLE